MIIGHVGAAFIARRIFPRVSMKALLLATFAPDLLRLVFIPFGMWSGDSNVYTHIYPWSIGVAAFTAAGAWLFTNRQRDAAIAAAALVTSHVLLDMISGQKVLWDHGPRGWNLDRHYWQYEMLLEAALVIGGWILMRPAVGPRWKRPRIVVALVLVEFAALSFGIYEKPYRERCFAHPFMDCDGDSILTDRWTFRLPV